MKKFLVLMLVLGMASLANATLTITVDGAAVDVIELKPSDEVAIGICSDDGARYDAYIIMTDGLEYAEWLVGREVVYNNVITEDDAAWVYYGTDVNPAMDAYFAAFSITGETPYNPGIGGEVIFHCLGVDPATGEGTVTITLFDAAFAPIDTLTIHQIPEPMTLALLGLGGLFLRRRK